MQGVEPWCRKHSNQHSFTCLVIFVLVGRLLPTTDTFIQKPTGFFSSVAGYFKLANCCSKRPTLNYHNNLVDFGAA